MRLELSRRARADLDDIRDYSVAHFGPARAILYLDAVEAAFRHILEYPKIGEARRNITGTLRSLAVGEHRVYYSAGADTILVLRVLHKAMDVVSHL